MSDRISQWLLHFAGPDFLENFTPPPDPEYPNENLRQWLERSVQEDSLVDDDLLRAGELHWKYLKKLSKEGHPAGEKFVDFTTDEYFDEFVTQQGMSPEFVRRVISGPIAIFSTRSLGKPRAKPSTSDTGTATSEEPQNKSRGK